MERWDKQLSECKTNTDRALLARSYECDPVLLRAFCYDDADILVVEEAALNPYSENHWVKHALTRFPSLDTVDFWRAREENLNILLKKIEEQGASIQGDRDQIILKHIMSKDMKRNAHALSHLGRAEYDENKPIAFKNPIKPWDESAKCKIAMVMAPSWGVIFPPYNLARLTSVLREYDYSVRVYDLNIESYQHLLNIVDIDFWNGTKYYMWIVRENFYSLILPKIKPLLDKAIEEIVESNPKVIGFSMYNTNMYATEYIFKELKRKLPDACYIAGGPEVTTTGQKHYLFKILPFNYLFVGEAEETLLSVLEELPEEYPTHKYIGSTDSKIKLENLPFIDYSDYNLNNYLRNDGVSLEASRGCVAQCSFCSETYFWKFRSIDPIRVADEIGYLIDTYGIKRIWFVDSLINGHLKHFEKLLDLIIERGYEISWNSYARCDGRMDRNFIKKIVDSGCTSLSYGVECGSQKVLNDMRKKIEIWEIENNLRHGHEVKLFNHVNWMVGFPTEEPIDFMHSLQLLTNTRYYIDSISPGFTTGIAEQSHMQTDYKVYKIVAKETPGDTTFLNNWFTEGFKNTALHRFVRLKMLHVWLDILEVYAGANILNGHKLTGTRSYYKFESANTCKDYITNDNFVCLDRLDNTIFQNGITNEFFSIAYVLYLYFGAVKFELYYDPEIDLPCFGNTYTNNYTATLKFEVTDEGNYTLSLKQKFVHKALADHLEPIYENEKTERGDLSFEMIYNDSGNINDWVASEVQTKETVHEQYRKKKVITILPAGE